MPSQNLVNAGRNSSVLIHEATMADDEADLAKKKAHSTVGEAISVGTRYLFLLLSQAIEAKTAD